MEHKIVRGLKLAGGAPKNLLFRATGGHLKPRWLMFAVTDRCNSPCQHCDIWRKKPAKDPLEPKEIERMLSEPLFDEVEYILNSGGEPTGRDDLRLIRKAFIGYIRNGGDGSDEMALRSLMKRMLRKVK